MQRDNYPLEFSDVDLAELTGATRAPKKFLKESFDNFEPPEFLLHHHHPNQTRAVSVESGPPSPVGGLRTGCGGGSKGKAYSQSIRPIL